MTQEYPTQEEINRRLTERQDRLEKAIRQLAEDVNWTNVDGVIQNIDNILAGKE